MNSFYVSYLFILVLFVFSSCEIKTARETSSQPNVVIIFIDDMGYADPSCFGNPLVQTPNIDKLAAQGLKLTNFYINSPICSPSRTAINTGQYPMRHRIHSYLDASKRNRDRNLVDFLDPGVNTLAKTLKANGYATAHIGKWHLGGGRDVDYAPLIQEYGFDKSFTSFEGLGDRLLFKGHGLSERSAELKKGKLVWVEKREATRIYVDSALAFVDKNRENPFFLHLFPDDVHDHHLPRPEDAARFAAVTDNPWEQKFLAVLETLDQELGRFLSGLESRGVLENTLLIFTSDNGPTDWGRYYDRSKYPDDYEGALYAPGFAGEFSGRKWSLFEGGIRMPFIASWPGHIQPGTTDNETIMSAVDIYPSVCSILGVEFPADLDGFDKSRALLGEPIAKTPPIMWEYGSAPGGSILPGNKEHRSPNLAMRHGDWKLLMNADSTQLMLYNLQEDPQEQNNLLEEQAEVARAMALKLLTWRRSMPVAIAE